MSQPIRCEPLPFVQPSGEAATDALPRTEGEGTAFSAVLNAELEEAPVESDDSEETSSDQTPKEIDALAVYGVAPLLLQLIPQEPLKPACSAPLANVEGEEISSETAVLAQEQGETPERPTEESTDLAKTYEAQSARPKEVLLRESERPPEQKLPTLQEADVEQISGKAREPVKKSSGMVVAQAPPMLMTSQNQNEKAPQAERALGLEQFDAGSFEQPIRVEPLQSRPVRSEKIEISDIVGLETDRQQAPRFEVVSGDFEIQPAKPVEPATVIEGIRTHVELLKGATAEKLDVVLRPDAQTELHIQVEKVNGQIQVQARCDRGDFSTLEAHWGAIQNTLGTQGIRVEPLQQGDGAQLQQNGSQNSQGFLGQNPNQREERGTFSNEQEFTHREENRPKASRGNAARGWQSWA